jgi:hypothetical protein
MGDTPAQQVSAVGDLASQVNRFGAKAPAGYQFVTTPFPTSLSALSLDLAIAAVTIAQRAATDSYEKFHDQGSAQAIDAANAGFSNPIPFVNANMASVTQTIANLGDSLGLPPASASTVDIAGLGFEPTTLLLLVAGGVALYYWMGRE